MGDKTIDNLGERVVRALASGTSRRGFMSRLGLALVAAPAFPLLPVARGAEGKSGGVANTAFARKAQTGDDKQCDYWRYCAIDGALCTCCGGGVHSCPPGSTPSTTTWIGTCLNPDDKQTYLIAYYDCCGPTYCGQCTCDNTDRATPIYRPQGNNEIIWCFGTPSMAYHCSTAALVGLAG